MTAGPESMRAIVGAVVGLLYGSILAFVSSFLFGGSHGTSIPLLLSSAPLGVFALVGKLVGDPYLGYGYNAMLLGTPLVWGALGSLVALSGDGKMLRLAQSLALLHYASGLALVAIIGPEHPELSLRVDVALWASAYLAGQVVLWSSMRAGSESRRAIVGAMAGVSYGSILAFLSMFAAGGGHGTSIPLWLSSAPLSAFGLVGWPMGGSDVGAFAMVLGAPLVWAALGALAALSGRGTSLRLTRVLVLLHYASGLALVAATGAGPTGLAGEVSDFFIVWAPVYLVGQVALWRRISRRNQLRPTV
jgi:hypothetical protein